MCYSMIYLADSCNPFFVLLFNIQSILQIYNNNLLYLYQIYIDSYKLYYFDNNSRTYKTIVFGSSGNVFTRSCFSSKLYYILISNAYFSRNFQFNT